MRHLKLTRAHELPVRSAEERWLIEGLWGNAAVGVIGGEPKALKTSLAVDMAVSVASGQPCLRHYPVRQTGPVLMFIAEDSASEVRHRLQALADLLELELRSLPIHLIEESQLRLDVEEDREALVEAVRAVRPRLLVLDPFVRLHSGVDENSSGAVAPLLGFLRFLQREYDMAVVLVHHSRKRRGAGREGQALRGSSDFHAWGDSNLYLRRDEHRAADLWLTTEHRAAMSEAGIALEQRYLGTTFTLAWVDPAAHRAGKKAATTDEKAEPRERVLEALSDGPRTLTQVRDEVHLRHDRVRQVVDELIAEGAITREGTKLKPVVRPGSRSHSGKP